MPVFILHDITLDLPEVLITKALAARLADGSYEADEIAAAMCRVGPGMRVLDLGAGLGLISVLAVVNAVEAWPTRDPPRPISSSAADLGYPQVCGPDPGPCVLPVDNSA